MRILIYKCSGRVEDDWNFSEIKFGRINLLVGDTATGKTRLLNTIFNIGSFVATGKFTPGFWDITFIQSDRKYRWQLRSDIPDNSDSPRIIEERLWSIEDGRKKPIVERTLDKFKYMGTLLPKLSSMVTSISLLNEEDEINPIYEGFKTIRRRRFFSDDLAKISYLDPITPEIIERFERDRSLRNLYKSKLGLNATLFILSKFFTETYNLIKKYYKAAFPFIEDVSVLDLNKIVKPAGIAVENIPVFCIKERKSPQWIPLPELSSGMQKVLLILTDTFVLPDEAIYLIDEYENSLGISAIDFFPGFVFDLNKEIQFIVTSHHPYLINAIPPKNWYIFHRKGTKVDIRYGNELETRFGKSKQMAFIQLINDPFYIDGVE